MDIYNERDRLIALLSTFYHSYLSYDKDGEEGFRNVVYIETDAGQLSWHIADNELPLFSHLPKADNKWDGHSTETKYKRVEELVKLNSQINFSSTAQEIMERIQRIKDELL